MMPLGVEHGASMAHCPSAKCDVSKPLMPLGVEHFLMHEGRSEKKLVSKPLMPLGVEHIDSQISHAFASCV